MAVVGRDEHEPEIGDIAAALEARDVLEDVVAIVRFSLVRFSAETRYPDVHVFRDLR